MANYFKDKKKLIENTAILEPQDDEQSRGHTTLSAQKFPETLQQ